MVGGIVQIWSWLPCILDKAAVHILETQRVSQYRHFSAPTENVLQLSTETLK